MEKRYVGDLEANGFLHQASQVHCGVFLSTDRKDRVTFNPSQIEEMMEFMDTCDELIFHNGTGYDFPLLEKLYGYTYKGKKTDTMVMSKLYKPNRYVPPTVPRGMRNKPHSLGVWGYRVGRGKPDHDDWENYTPDMLHRCSEDTEITLLVLEELEKEQYDERYDWKYATYLTNRLFEIVGKQEAYGWLIDQPWALKALSTLDRWTRWIDAVLANRLPIITHCDEKKNREGVLGYVKKPFNMNGSYSANMEKWFLDTSHTSYEQIDRMEDREVRGQFSRVSFKRVDPNKRIEAIDYLLSVGWIPDEWNLDDDGNRTSPKLSKNDSFTGVQGRVGNLFARRMQIKSRRSYIAGYLKRVREDGRMASRVTGLAETGRAKHADIVNVPNAEAFFGKWMRKIFSSPSDKVLIGTDSAGCQNRMLAARVGDPNFTNTLIHGKKEDKTSIHFINQKAVADAGYDVRYGMMKNLNYAFMFGASDNKLGTMIGKGKDDGGRIREAFLGVSAGFEKLLEEITYEWRSHAKQRKNPWGKPEWYNGWLTGLDGRPIFIDSEHKLLVYLLQSDEAIMMSAAYVFLYDWLTEEGFVWGIDWAYVNWNHDEYTLEVLPKHVDRIRYLSEQAITKAGEYFHIACPHEGESNVGNNWYDIH